MREVFSIDKLPSLIKRNEIAIINLDHEIGLGTHWVCYVKKANQIYYYYNSFGNLHCPKELLSYFGNTNIFYNYNQEQNYGSVICGHLCLQFIINKVAELFLVMHSKIFQLSVPTFGSDSKILNDKIKEIIHTSVENLQKKFRISDWKNLG